MGHKLARMSYSSIIRESEDFGCALCDEQGRQLCESAQSTPLQSGPIPGYVQGINRRFAELGLDWEYDAVDCRSEDLAAFVTGLDATWAGLSLTMPRTPVPPSRLPAVGTTIFTVMSALATEHGAVNLGQGFPDFDCDPRLIECVSDAMRRGLNQYPPMTGVAVLREAIADKVESLYGYRYDPTTEITVTAGATQAILSAILAIVRAGDEVMALITEDAEGAVARLLIG